MSDWMRPNCRTSCCPTTLRGQRVTTTHFLYDAAATPYPADTVPLSKLQGIDQLVIDGVMSAPNTIIYMPPHTALLDLFRDPRADDQLAIDVSNAGTNSIDLTIYKANTEPTGSGFDTYTMPIRIATVPASGVVRLYFRVVDATPVTGVADVKMLVTLEGGTGSLPMPSTVYDMGPGAFANNAPIIAQQVVPGLVGPPYQLLFTGGTAACTATLSVPTPSQGPAQLLYANGLTSGPPLVSPLVAGDVFELVLFSNNQSGRSLAWSAGGIVGVTLAGLSSVAQPTGTSYRVTMRFTIAGTAPLFLGSTLVVNLSAPGGLWVGSTVPTVAATPVANPFLAYGLVDVEYATSLATDREWAAQVNMVSAAGTGSGTSEKVALFSGARQLVGSGSCWAANFVVDNTGQGAGVGANGLVGVEIDMNNSNSSIPASVVAGPAYTVALFISGSGVGAQNQAAINISGANNMWYRGLYFDNANNGSCQTSAIEDNSSATQSYLITGGAGAGTHTYGFNAMDAAISTAVLTMPNNKPIAAKDSGGTLRSLLSFNASNQVVVGYAGSGASSFVPATTNVYSCGTAPLIWSAVFATTGVVSTSDERLKRDVAPISDAALDAWAEVDFVEYRWNESVETKGEAAARYHVGVMAQRVEAAFARHGVDTFSRGVLCRDTIEQGERYSVRYEQALVMEAALMRRTMRRLEARLATCPPPLE